MKHILITCDTEIGEIGMKSLREDAFELFIEGKIDSNEVGYKKINEIADKYNAKIDHFVDIYPYERYGEEKFFNLCNNIINMGHELHLHTHPSGKYDKNRKLMWQYTLNEQKEIIKHGINKIKEWTGLNTIAHRAGAYGANDNTLHALKMCDIKIDSSFNLSSKNCKITYPYKNSPSYYLNVFQIPVTVYLKKIYYSPTIILKRTRLNKLDFRYGSNVKEILSVILNAPENAVLVLFLHSCNFMRIPYFYRRNKIGKITIDYNLINDFALLLKEINRLPDAKFSTIKEVHNKFKGEKDFLVDVKSTENITKPIFKELKKKIGIDYK